MRAKLDIDTEIAALGDLSQMELAARWQKIYKCPPPTGVRRELLIRATAWHLQAKRLGGYSVETRRLLKAAMDRVEKKLVGRICQSADTGDVADDGIATVSNNPKRQRRQLLPGARLLRDWNGRTHVVDCAGNRLCLRGEGLSLADGDRPQDHGCALVWSEVLRAMSTGNTTRRLRCAVYTRKSTEEGLDQEFNSLDAQRESCVAYIASQAGVGWKLIPDHYDDGGISGGTLDRPAIQRLLQDIRDKKVDVVVVYKIDRLTRSLTDFSRIVEIFDASSVSFVSITQQFNTTTSMGRLTLNVLLSFAQFEREVTAEQIRDKIAASKKKGMWMGGTVSLGYQVRDRKLVIKEPEASFVRSLFDRYLQLRSVPDLSDELAREAITGQLLLSDGAPAYTRPIRSATLYKILANPIYVGKLRHRQNIYDGEHEPIIGVDRFAEVQALLAAQASTPRGSTAKRDVHLLSGLLFDDTGDRMGPTHANKQGKRYRYCVSRRIIDGKAAGTDGWRIPARELESAVQNFAMHLLSNRSQLAAWIGEYASSSQTQSGLAGADCMRKRCDEEQPAAVRRDLFKRFFRLITLTTTAIRFDIRVSAIVRMLVEADGSTLSSDSDADEVGSATMTLEMPISLKRRGNEQRLIIDSSFTPMRTPDAAIVDLVAKAHLLFGKLTELPGRSVTDIAKSFGIDRADVGRILPLVFLAPRVVEVVLHGRHPQSLSPRTLARMHLPQLWAEQVVVIQ